MVERRRTLAVVIASAAAAAALACTPHPGLGTVVYAQGATQHAVDLATCRETSRPAPRPRPSTTPGLRVAAERHGKSGSESIVLDGRVVLTVHESYATVPAGTPGPIMLFGLSPGRTWVLYAIDPQGSASLAADGLTISAVSSAGGKPRTVEFGLLDERYRAWCGGRLAAVAGGDRITTHAKRLVVTGPPAWRATLLVRAPGRAWGSVACEPGGRAVVVQSQRASADDESSSEAHWALWRVGLDGAQQRLTSPPAGSADDSPRFAGGILYFVRSHAGAGSLYAMKDGKLLGPLVSLGPDLGSFGNYDWPYSVRP
jgi:hypothetical protein